MDFRLPVQDLQAEKSILGSMLIDNTVLSSVFKSLNPEDFVQEEHSAIYKTCRELFDKNKPVDIVTVQNALKADIGMLEYITNMAEGVPTTANVMHYVGIVKDKSVRRKYIKAAQDVIDVSYDGKYESTIDFKNDVLQKMDIEVFDSKKEKTHIKDVAIETLGLIEERYNRKEADKKYYGLEWLDKMTGGAHDGELTLLAARPSVGKTALALQFGLNMAYRDNKIAIFSLEMSRNNLSERLISNMSGINSKKIRYAKSLEETDWTVINEALQELVTMDISIYDNMKNVEDIRATCRDLKNTSELDFVIIDYLHLCDTNKKYNGSTERISHLSRQCKLMTMEFKIPFLVLSQLNRANEHDNRRPRLSDLRQSGSLEQDADNVIFLHDENYGKYTQSTPGFATPIEIIIAKQRNGERDIYNEIGFKKEIQRFTEYLTEKEKAGFQANKK